jgi:hypothetical protein
LIQGAAGTLYFEPGGVSFAAAAFQDGAIASIVSFGSSAAVVRWMPKIDRPVKARFKDTDYDHHILLVSSDVRISGSSAFLV